MTPGLKFCCCCRSRRSVVNHLSSSNLHMSKVKYMSLLTFKKTRNRLTGKFFYIVKNALAYRSLRKDWVLRIPRAILKTAKFHVGDCVDFSVKNDTLFMRKRPMKTVRGSSRNDIRKKFKRNAHVEQ